MSTIMKRFTKGIVLRGETTDSTENAEGSLFQNSSDSRIKAYIEGAVRQVVTNSQSQVLTNKTIVDVVLNNNVAGVTGSSLETDLSISAASNKLATAAAIKTYIDNKVASKDEASEISVSPAVNGKTNVQDSLEDHETRIDATEAHVAASSGVHGIAGSVVGTSDSQTLTNKTIDASSNTISNIENSNIKSGAAIDASKIADGSVSSTEFQYLSNVTSDIQTQINSKQATITGAATTIISSDLSASKVVVSDASGKIAASSVTSTTLGYLDATSSVQTQLNSKANSSGATLTSASIQDPARADVKKDTYANLVTYASTASNGQLCFATDTKVLYQIVDGALAGVGGSTYIDTLTFSSPEALSLNDAVYISSAGNVSKADATSTKKNFFGFVKSIIPAAGPATFTETFESGSFGTNSWTVVNGSQTNKFFVGTATSQSGSYSAYISNDSGTSNVYTNTATSGVYFYKDITVGSSDQLSFYYKLAGESIFDFGRIIIDPTVSVVPTAGSDYTSIPSGGINTKLTSTSNIWTQTSISLVPYANTTVRIIFGWYNDFSGGTNPPIAIDSISIAAVPTYSIQFSGLFQSLSGLTIGSSYYLSSSTPGAISTTAPSTSNFPVVVGQAVSSSTLLINQVASAGVTATDTETSFTIANNTASATNVTGLSFTGSTYRSFLIEYSIYRGTATASSALAQVGQLRGVYNTQALTWYLSDTYAGQNAGVTFSITAAGQLQYTSTNIAGTSYTGTMKYFISKRFLVA